MKKFMLLLSVLISTMCSMGQMAFRDRDTSGEDQPLMVQIWDPQVVHYTFIAQNYRWLRGYFMHSFHVPRGTTPSLNDGFEDPGALFFDTDEGASGSLKVWNGAGWDMIGAGGGAADTTILATRARDLKTWDSLTRVHAIYNQYSVKETKNTFYDTAKLRKLIVGSIDSAYLNWMALGGDKTSVIWKDGKTATFRDRDTSSAFNDLNPDELVNTNVLVERLTRVDPAHSTVQRQNFAAVQWYETRSGGYVNPLSGNVGASILGITQIKNAPGIGGDTLYMLGGVSGLYTPTILGNFGSAHDINTPVGTKITMHGHWAVFGAHRNIGPDDSASIVSSYADMGYAYGKYGTLVKAYWPTTTILDQASRNWGIFNPDNSLENNYQLLGGRMVVGSSTGLGTLEAPTFEESAGIHLNSTKRGILPSRLTQAQETAISSPANYLMLVNTDSARLRMHVGSGVYKSFAFLDDIGTPGGGGGSPAGNLGNIQINRYGSFATPASDSLHWNDGLEVKKQLRIFNATTNAFAISSNTATTDALMMLHDGFNATLYANGATTLNISTNAQWVRLSPAFTTVLHATSTGVRIGSSTNPVYPLDVTGQAYISTELLVGIPDQGAWGLQVDARGFIYGNTSDGSNITFALYADNGALRNAWWSDGRYGVNFSTHPDAVIEITDENRPIILRHNTNSQYFQLEFRDEANTSSSAAVVGFTGTAYTVYWTGGYSGQQMVVGTVGNDAITFGTNNTFRGMILGSEFIWGSNADAGTFAGQFTGGMYWDVTGAQARLVGVGTDNTITSVYGVDGSGNVKLRTVASLGGGSDTHLGTNDITQDAGEDRTYDVNSEDLSFTNFDAFSIDAGSNYYLSVTPSQTQLGGANSELTNNSTGMSLDIVSGKLLFNLNDTDGDWEITDLTNQGSSATRVLVWQETSNDVHFRTAAQLLGDIGGQVGIQFKDPSGGNLGTIGLVNSFTLLGKGVQETASVSDVVSYTIQGYDDWVDITQASTSNNTITTLHTYTPPDNSAGTLTAHIDAKLGGAGGSYHVELKVRFVKNGGVVTLGTVTESISGEYVGSGLSTAVATLDLSSNTIRVRVTGETGDTIWWDGIIFVSFSEDNS